MFPSGPVTQKSIFKKIFQGIWIHYLCLIDEYSGWITPAILKGRKIVKKNRTGIIIATGPPFSALVVGYLISLMTGAKLILDYRDPWSNHDRRFCKILGKKIARNLERLAIKRASALVFLSQIMKNNFIDDLGRFADAPCYVISNGFKNNNTIQQLSFAKGKKNMVYAGNFYDQRKIGLLCKPLQRLLAEGAISKNTFCVHVFGELKNEDRRIINECGLNEIVKAYAQVPYAQILRYLNAADMLLLISASNVRYAIPLKFFDYLSARKPIFAIAAEDSAVADLMSEIDCGRLALINNEESILDNLRKMIFQQKEYTFSGAERYVWEKIGNRYLEVIENVERKN
jgi:glycosyltransferase involved in cell wall biosynthesis